MASKLPTLLVAGSLHLGEGDVPPGVTPVEYILTWIRARMPEFGGHDARLANRILVVQSDTGSGKSTVLPVAVFRILRNEKTPAKMRYRGPGVICTQPRVMTAIALAKVVSGTSERRGGKLNPDMVLGETVGFQTGPISNKPPAGLMYATAGVLAAQLRMNEDAYVMGRYRFILVDEAHERSLDADMVLMQLRNFYVRNAGNPRLPFLLLTSATFDTQRYAAYFGVGTANTLRVVGRTYPVVPRWPATGTNDYTREAVRKAVEIHEQNADDDPNAADILIFVPGALETRLVAEALIKANRKYETGPLAPMLVLNINRPVVISQSGDYTLVFAAPADLPDVLGRRPLRRVVISTVVAETGLTIDTLKYVVDCGWNRTREVYQPWGVEGLVTRPAPKSRIKQRSGRVGRLFPGEFHPLYTESVHSQLEDQQLPDIFSSGSLEIHLALIQEQARSAPGKPFRVEDISLLDPPPPEAFLYANAVTTALGFTHATGLTALGEVAARFSRTPVEGIRVLLAGYVWGAAAQDLATIVALFGTSPANLQLPAERRAVGAPLPPGAAALRAALPTSIVERATATGGAAAALPPSDSEAFYFRARLAIADDFVEQMLIVQLYLRRLDLSEGDFLAADDYLAECGINPVALQEVVRRRALILEEMVVAGLNPFRLPEQALHGLPADAFMDGVVRIKQCLYDGLRTHTLELDGDQYRTAQGLRVKVPELLGDAMQARMRALGVVLPAGWRPRWLLTEQVRLMPVGTDLIYAAEASQVSVLDGFVDVDPGFIGARV